MKTKVTSKGQVTIPKELRRRLGIRKGTVLEFRVEGGVLIAVKLGDRDPVDAVYGLLRDGRNSEDVLADLRGRT